jgi:hypothetical protein
VDEKQQERIKAMKKLLSALFVYTVSQVQICACTRICIWRREEVTEVRESKKACYTCFGGVKKQYHII